MYAGCFFWTLLRSAQSCKRNLNEGFDKMCRVSVSLMPTFEFRFHKRCAAIARNLSNPDC